MNDLLSPHTEYQPGAAEAAAYAAANLADVDLGVGDVDGNGEYFEDEEPADGGSYAEAAYGEIGSEYDGADEPSTPPFTMTGRRMADDEPMPDWVGGPYVDAEIHDDDAPETDRGGGTPPDDGNNDEPPTGGGEFDGEPEPDDQSDQQASTRTETGFSMTITGPNGEPLEDIIEGKGPVTTTADDQTRQTHLERILDEVILGSGVLGDDTDSHPDTADGGQDAETVDEDSDTVVTMDVEERNQETEWDPHAGRPRPYDKATEAERDSADWSPLAVNDGQKGGGSPLVNTPNTITLRTEEPDDPARLVEKMGPEIGFNEAAGTPGNTATENTSGGTTGMVIDPSKGPGDTGPGIADLMRQADVGEAGGPRVVITPDTGGEIPLADKHTLDDFFTDRRGYDGPAGEPGPGAIPRDPEAERIFAKYMQQGLAAAGVDVPVGATMSEMTDAILASDAFGGAVPSTPGTEAPTGTSGGVSYSTSVGDVPASPFSGGLESLQPGEAMVVSDQGEPRGTYDIDTGDRRDDPRNEPWGTYETAPEGAYDEAYGGEPEPNAAGYEARNTPAPDAPEVPGGGNGGN
jgi:hypothetical protein